MSIKHEGPHLGHKLKQVIDTKGVTQAEVARYFGVAGPTVSADWLKYGRIAKKHYKKLVEFSGLPYEWWFGEAAADPYIDTVISHMLRMTRTEKAALARAVTSAAKQKTSKRG